VLEEELGVAPAAATTSLYEQVRAERPTPPRGEPGPPPEPRLPDYLEEGQPSEMPGPVFVGREAELARLEGYLEAAIEGVGQVAFVVGGAGRGKTALLRAFAERAMAAHPDLLVVSGACNAFSGVGDAYLPFREALGMLTGDVERRWAAGTVSADHARRLWSALPVTLLALVQHGPHAISGLVSGKQLIARATEAGLAEAAWVPELRSLSGRATGGGLEQPALFHQVTNVLHAVSSAHPVMLVLDDLHWADQGSMGLLMHFGRRLAGSRVLVVGAYRPEEATLTSGVASDSTAAVLRELRRQYGDVWIDLRDADAVNGERLVNALLDAEPNRLGDDFRSALYARTGGHALFTVELLRTLQESAALRRDGEGCWVADADLEWGALPARVTAVIESRLDRVGPVARNLLAVASVEGETFTVDVLAEVQGLSQRATLRHLSELAKRHRVVREVAAVRRDGTTVSRYAFSHALFQVYLYEELSEAECRLLHGEIAGSLEDLYAAESDAIAPQLALHYAHAEDRPKAVEWAVSAGDQARATYANAEAIGWYERVMALTEELDESAASLTWRLQALSGLGKVCYHTGEIGEAEHHFREAIALGKRLEVDPQELALLMHWLGEALFWLAKYEERLRLAEEGLAMLGDDTESLGVALMNQLVTVCVMFGEYQRAAAHTLRTASFIGDLPYVEELLPAYDHIGMVYGSLHEAEGMLRLLDQLDLRAQESGDLKALTIASLERASFLDRSGHLRGALRQRQRQLEISTRTGNVGYRSSAHLSLARLARSLGDLDGAEIHLRQARDLFEKTGAVRGLPAGYQRAGSLALCRGDWSRAIVLFRKAELLWVEAGSNFSPVETRLFLGRAHLAAEALSTAQQCFEASLRLLATTKEITVSDQVELLPPILGGLERTYDDAGAFRAPESAQDNLLARVGWSWIDSYGDCDYSQGTALEMRASNGRGLRGINWSAPRLMRDLPVALAGVVAQVTCEPALADRPAIGGLLLWRSQHDYLWLEVGRFGPGDVALGGCQDRKDFIAGRGRLLAGSEPGWAMGEPVTLRLEITGERVEALCSSDGEHWYSVGQTSFPLDGEAQVGLHAIGDIDRTIYPGAYPDGTAIRFTDFSLSTS